MYNVSVLATVPNLVMKDVDKWFGNLWEGTFVLEYNWKCK